jgi:WD40 repeat protein
MKQRLLVFNGSSLTTETVDAPGHLRWAAWSRADEGESALLVGDRGTLVSYNQGGFKRIRTHTTQNLRCVEFSPKGDTAYVCGNGGTILTATLGWSKPLKAGDARENLRRIGWSPKGDLALVVGNEGAAYTLRHDGRLARVQGAETNLRSVAWHPRESYALVLGNCFHDSVGGLTPSANLFRFDEVAGSLVELRDIAESRADLTAASWRPDGSSCLLVGFDQTWHTPASFSYAQGSLRQIPWHGAGLFPTNCAWHPSGGYALAGTCLMRAGEGDCSLYSYDGGVEGVRKVSALGDFGVACIAWSPDGCRAILTGSASARAFSV